jgi:predicted transposase YbfD/YdcC
MDISKLKTEIATIKDPRREWGNKRHKLEDILIIGLCSTICNGEDFVDMEEFGNDRESWLRTFLELPNGIPDSDTFRRVFERVESVALAKGLNAWLDNASKTSPRNVAIDGKTIRGSASATHSAYHVVSAWVQDNSITLGELAVAEKSNEITAIPELLELVDIKGDTVTIDAMGCQNEIATKIYDKGADYVLALKGNQPTLHDEVNQYFDWLEREKPSDEHFQTWIGKPEKGHGRIEQGEVVVASAAWLDAKERERWPGLRTLVRCRCVSERGGVQSVSTRHFISSCVPDAQKLAGLVRGHWAIENGLHWMLDVVFGEDAARAKKDHSPLNMNVLRKISIALLRPAAPGTRLSVRKKMMKSSRDPSFLNAIISKKWEKTSVVYVK